MSITIIFFLLQYLSPQTTCSDNNRSNHRIDAIVQGCWLRSIHCFVCLYPSGDVHTSQDIISKDDRYTLSVVVIPDVDSNDRISERISFARAAWPFYAGPVHVHSKETSSRKKLIMTTMINKLTKNDNSVGYNDIWHLKIVTTKHIFPITRRKHIFIFIIFT